MKDIIAESLRTIENVCRKYDLHTLSEKMSKVQTELDEFVLKILFVGSFSAGKSALINAMLQRELLEENQRPETAIASELLFGDEEYIEAVQGTKCDKYSIDDSAQIDLNKYSHLVWHINSPILKELDGTVLVDMPGFNSGIKEHNKAIFQYVGNGNAYILVIDCEDGGIKQSEVSFINEIKSYNNNLALAITKADLKMPKDVEQIKSRIISDAENLFIGSVPVETVSREFDDTPQKMKSLIQSFDRNIILLNQFRPIVDEVGVKCIQSLTTYKKSLNLDVSEFDDRIRQHEKEKKHLSDKLRKEQKKLENDFTNHVTPSILADVKNSLYQNTDTLLSAMKSGGNNFSMAVNNILRPVLINSTQKYVDQSFEQFIQQIDIGQNVFDSSIENIASESAEKFQKASGALSKIVQTSDKFNGLYKAVTTVLSVATSFVAPWLELIIIFLPDILKLFSKGTQESGMRRKLTEEIIPQICSQLRPEIENSLVQMKDEMLEQVNEQFAELIDSEVEALETAKKEKADLSAKNEDDLKEVEKDIEDVKKAMDALH